MRFFDKLVFIFYIDEEDYDLDIAAAGALIRSARDETPICNSVEHKELGLDEQCLLPICGSEEYRSIGIEQDCLPPVCGSENHKYVGLESNCTKPVCNSIDHEKVGLDTECLPICNSEEHKAQGLDLDCRKPINEKTFVVGSSIANAWMYDGDVWNNIKPLSAPRERPACTLVQTDEGVSIQSLIIYSLSAFHPSET